MLIFLYGSLRDPVLLSQIAGDPRLGLSLRPARLGGYARVHIGGWNARYASVVRQPGAAVEGFVARLTAPAQPRLTAYEGSSYEMRRVRALIDGQYRMVGIWMARAVTRRVWTEPTDLRRVRMERSSTRHA
ncbi:gamma-glutamylcyclotransferase [Acidisoma cellulosilytica]|uniref:Gamma-glutamylcyclotransferase n=1 Tax=Acidisoma cellulosilyticum TaxID=2802395 RepID=A0A963Z352_9PROT|nr:gamma-glutamylcyclotransferase family protein [Acidisoma cellulosilyticum]MCB8880943.1 gamma-glutamylcyclotransferase [Acidisoma cellulosilyticum]